LRLSLMRISVVFEIRTGGVLRAKRYVVLAVRTGRP
jgi:hypothetical protein